MKQKLTSWEWEALVSRTNLADGHAHQALNKQQEKVINDLPELFRMSESESQEVIQTEFEKIFFEKAGQKTYKKLLPPKYHYACSISIEIVANYLRLQNKSLSLIHPTFDNLADIFKRHKVNISAVEEDDLVNSAKLKAISTDALMIVCPNNPTGQEITKKQFENIVNICKKKDVLLIIDFSFRFYSSFKTWDQYEVLMNSGIDFILLEDTGKTFPTLDLKLGILLSSEEIYDQLNDITNDFLLNVSPFIFKILTYYLKTESTSKNFSFQRVINKNRSAIVKAFKGSVFEVQNPNSSISVAWIKIPQNVISSSLCRWLETKQIFVLPGNPFFWNNPKRGDSYIRVALARPTDFFEKAIQKLAKACLGYIND